MNPEGAKAQVAFAVLVAAIAAAMSCEAENTRPSRVEPPSLRISCPPPTSADVACTAYLLHGRFRQTVDVTLSATWAAAPPTLGNYVAAGVFRPAARGEVEVSASYRQWSDTGPKFLVDPAENARWLYFAQFTAVEEDKSTRVPGVTVLVTTGYRSGWSCVTNAVGICSLEDLLTLEEFRVVASKDGYHAAEFSQMIGPPFDPYPFPAATIVMRRQ